MESVDKIFTNYTLCALCKGGCCKSLPGGYHPADIERVFEKPITIGLLVEAFLTEKIAVDWWEGDPRYEFEDPRQAHNDGDGLGECYYLRPRGVNAIDQLEDGGWRDNACMHLNLETGCELPEHNRPFGCRAMVPNPLSFPNGCSYSKEVDGSKRAISLAWLPYQAMISQAVKIYKEVKGINDEEE